MARLEGAYEQVADRLNGIDHRLEAIEKKIDSNLRTIITWMLGQTAVILGAVAAFALHH